MGGDTGDSCRLSAPRPHDGRPARDDGQEEEGGCDHGEAAGGNHSSQGRGPSGRCQGIPPCLLPWTWNQGASWNQCISSCINPDESPQGLLPRPFLASYSFPGACGQLTRDVARGRGFLGDHAGKKAMLLRALELQRALFGRSYIEDVDYSRTLLFLASAHVLLGEVESANRCVPRGS